MAGHVESKLEEEDSNTDQKKVFDFSESVAIGISDQKIDISGDDLKYVGQDTVKAGIFDIFQFADATDRACMAFALLMTALSGANQVTK
jgi:hypothetical protein